MSFMPLSEEINYYWTNPVLLIKDQDAFPVLRGLNSSGEDVAFVILDE